MKRILAILALIASAVALYAAAVAPTADPVHPGNYTNKELLRYIADYTQDGYVLATAPTANPVHPGNLTEKELLRYIADYTQQGGGGGGGSGDFMANGSVPMTGALTFSGTTHPGLRLNNLTTTQRDAITPLTGYTVWNTTTGQAEAYDGASWDALGSGGSQAGAFGITVDGGSSVLTSGNKGIVIVPFACTITGWSIVADQSGSVTFGVEKAADGVIPSTSIVASAAPALTASQITRSTTLTGWTTSVAANDVIEFTITGTPATITRATLQIQYTK